MKNNRTRDSGNELQILNIEKGNTNNRYVNYN